MSDSTQTNWSAETDESLLDILAVFRNDDKETSDKAFEVFIKRYKDFIWTISVRTTHGHLNREVLKEYLYSEILTDIYTKSNGFSVGSETDALVRKKRICGWIIRIAKNAYYRLLKNEERSTDVEMLISEPYIETEEEESLPTLSEGHIQKAFERLSERDKDVLWTYWRYHEMGEGSQAKNLPSDVLSELCEKHQTTNSNIRAIISRGNKVVKDYLMAQSEILKHLQDVK